jgi:acyl-CoA synthetase (AMP-forming)/AMP-acid ligase II
MNLLQRIRFARDRSLTVSNLVDELLCRMGDREVGEEEDRKWMLAELHDEVCRIDSFLRNAIQLRPGQPVAIYRSNDARCFHWFLGVIRAGGVAVPLNPLLSLSEVRRILADSRTDILVTDRAVFERSIIDRSALNVRTWIQSERRDDNATAMEGFLRMSGGGEAALPPTVIDPTATIAVFHTSGTSGYPKGAALSSNALLGGRISTVFFGLVLGRNDLALVALPWSHIMGVSIALNGMMAGVRGCIVSHFEVDRALELIDRLGVTAVVGVPTMFAKLVNSNPDPKQLAKVRLWLSASDYLPTEVRERLRQFGALVRLPFGGRIPPLLLNGYGMVELGGLAMLGIEISFLRGSSELCFPVPPYRIRVADETGRPVPAGGEGECQIWRRGIRPHYWKDGTSDEALLTEDGWLHTGDLARKNKLGLIRLVGRTKDVFKSGGYSIYVRELEETITAHPAVARAAAFGLPHAEKGEIPAAAVELREGWPASEAELLNWGREHLAAYKAPRRIWIVEPGSLPQNHNGKVLRRVLRERFAAEA